MNANDPSQDLVEEVRDPDGAAPVEAPVVDGTTPDDPDARARLEQAASWVVVGLCSLFVLGWLQPRLLITNTTPTGGDMGAHVWGPQFLADHLLPSGRVTGWTQDWYAGFPAYVFYMVVPSLAIVWIAAAPSASLIPVLLAALGGLALWGRSRVPADWVPRLRHAAVACAVLGTLTLVLVAADVGLPRWISSVLMLAVAAGVAAMAIDAADSRRWARVPLWAGAVFLAVLALPIPYNVAFKLVTVSGLVTLPIAAYALARSARAPFPVPPLVALATLPFIFDRGFTILGGNGASTMAGEFAFSISLTFALLYLAVLLRGIRTGRDRALGAVLLALTVLCHLIPAIFVVIATVVLLFVRRDERTPWWDGSKAGRIAAGGLVVVVLAVLVPSVQLPFDRVFTSPLPQWWFPVLGTVVALVLFTGFEPKLVQWWLTPVGRVVGALILVAGAALLITRSGWMTLTVVGLALVVAFFSGWDDRLVRWLLLSGPVGVLLTCFWTVPFLLSSTYMNDMGWEKYTRYKEYLLSDPTLDGGGMPYRNAVYALAGLGVVLSLIHRVRLGWFLTLNVVAFAWIFRYFPQYRLWNARLLPFFYLSLYLLAAIGVGLAIRSLAIAVADLRRRGDESVEVNIAGLTGVVVVLAIVLVGSFKMLPGGQLRPDPADTSRSVFRWAGMDLQTGVVPDWARWNYAGLEAKPAWAEFEGIIDMMDRVSDEHGCGRAMWEYHKDLDRFGTPMALMLLPHFTDGCIGSMEGLYFEASSTTPFHFLNQSALSEGPSRAQREMPYTPFDIDLGINQLQMLGVRYYMATTATAIDAARAHEDLTEVASERFASAADGSTIDEQEWVVFEVADSDLVTGLERTPVVLSDADDHIDGWVYAAERAEGVEGQPLPPKEPGPAVLWFQDPTRWDTHLATGGPSEWPRGSADEANGLSEELPEVEVSDISTTQDSISFRVDRTGVPVLVRTSYFPNWGADGAEGPWRVSPNFMVVVPTDEVVTLSYGRRWPDFLGWTLTLLGVGGVVLLAMLDARVAARDEEGTDDDAPDDPLDGDPLDPLDDGAPGDPVPDGPVPAGA